MKNDFKKAAEIVRGSKNCIALTGAGISVESGIPDYRSYGGIWDKYDPAEYAHIDGFMNAPEKIWDMIFELLELFADVKPNPAHTALASLEQMGYLKAVITQNIDNLHQVAGSNSVVEFHGNARRLDCLSCQKSFDPGEVLIELTPPRCDSCDAILKPGVVFFGEMIPRNALVQSQALAESADVVLVVGTSAVVYPASSIPMTAKNRGARIIEMNIEHTGLTNTITDIFLEGKVGKTLPKLVKLIRKG